MTKKPAVNVLSDDSEERPNSGDASKESQTRQARQYVNNLGKKKRFMLKRCRDFMTKYD